jgi:hypothetical protein
MLKTLFISGKLLDQSVSATADQGQGVSRLFVFDKVTGVRYLVDSGAAVSVFPPSRTQDRRISQPSQIKLYAANGTEIATWKNTIAC